MNMPWKKLNDSLIEIPTQAIRALQRLSESLSALSAANLRCITVSLALCILSLSACDFSNSQAGEGRINEPNQQSDPVVADIPIAYIERPLPRDIFNDDPEQRTIAVIDNVLDPTAFNPGAKLIIKARSKSDAPEIDITKDVFPNAEVDPDNDISEVVPTLFDIKDLDVSSDGTKLVFSMRAPNDPNINDEDDQPKWNLWQYDVINDELERVIQSDTIAELGHDVAPRFFYPMGKLFFLPTASAAPGQYYSMRGNHNMRVKPKIVRLMLLCFTSSTLAYKKLNKSPLMLTMTFSRRF